MNALAELAGLENRAGFVARHIGPSEPDIDAMLRVVGVPDLDTLTARTIPAAILAAPPRWDALPPAADEHATMAELRGLAERNAHGIKSLIGMGYHGTHTPPVIQRNVLENPGWYTAYTPYQAEIAQGRLEALLNFQTMVADLTGLPVANASLLDEATATAEAVTMAAAMRPKGGGDVVLAADDLHPQILAVLGTRAAPVGIALGAVAPDALVAEIAARRPFAVVLSYPGSTGALHDLRPLIAAAHAVGAQAIVAADPLALCLLTPPGELGADIVVGSTQRYGVPMGYGGPHAAFVAVRDGLKRVLPGRLVGVSRDAAGAPALRLALQTREQHIRREKATSNICTAQVLLAVMAGMYAVWHGPEGLTRIARRVALQARLLAGAASGAGFALRHDAFFDTLAVEAGDRADALMAAALAAGFNLRRIDATGIGVALDETVTRAELARLAAVFAEVSGGADAAPRGNGKATAAANAEPSARGIAAALPGVRAGAGANDAAGRVEQAPTRDTPSGGIPAALRRRSPFCTAPVFHAHRSEHAMLRYLKRLEDRDIALNRSMIPLGSCTMKLNATAEMIPIGFAGFANLHPFAPANQAGGYLEMIRTLQDWLCAVTGFAAVSLQPNAGSQGEFAGLLAIRAYHHARGDTQREVCLIPASAHGTNPASAVMAGMRVVLVGCDREGNVDLADLRAKAAQHADRLAALMVTYPSTHGVFEGEIRAICDLIHAHGGQVYMDGANMNAQVGLTSPAAIGADVCHLNLHKTFCIPHGGGGPGIGPIGVAAHLAPYLPNHPLLSAAGPATGFGPVSAAPFGSASILPISYAYIRLMGAAGLRRATQVAILSANYLARRLAPHFPVLYRGQGGMVAHECILDCRGYQASAGITVEDIAKRLVDYGYHAPTMSWPVAGTLMLEPTESEPREELDRFVDAMVAIRAEIGAIERGEADRADNPLKHAPHTAAAVTGTAWAHAYAREQAAFPLPYVRAHKFWPPVARVDNVHGDRNLVCTCPPLSDYAEAPSLAAE